MVAAFPKAPAPAQANTHHVHKHIRRLEQVWADTEVYLITICTRRRRSVLTDDALATEIVTALGDVSARAGWSIGRYVVMPDHVHFFCWRAAETHSLSEFVGLWKSWTTTRAWQQEHEGRLWQREFFDRLMRDEGSYAEKQEYVRQNPVRAGLCDDPEEWAHQGDMTPGA